MLKILLCGCNQNITCQVYLFFSYRFERSAYDLRKMYCGYIEGIYVHYTYCTLEKSIICEETAGNVQVESVLNDLPQESG